MKTYKFTARIVYSNGTDDCKVFLSWRSAMNWVNAQFKKDAGASANILAFIGGAAGNETPCACTA